ncbi:MAG: hypothetical protein ACRDTH_29315 [Pseudonocardiaceae bacterium]
MNRYLCSQAEACPACEQTEGVELTSTTARVEAWRCTRCGTSWVVSVVNPHLRDRAGDYAEEVGRLHWTLQRVIALADDADKLTDQQLRTRLLALAESCAR